MLLMSRIALSLLLLISGSMFAVTVQTQQSITLQKKREVTARFLLYLPEGYQDKREAKWPLVLFLHGAGERGDNLNKVKAHGPPKLVEKGQKFPFIIVSPQCPKDQRWDDAMLTVLLDHVCKEYRVDTSRLYLTGLSMGGYGSWSLGMALCDRFAAIAPICGGSAMEDECGMCGGNGLIEGYDCQGTPILFGHTGSFLQGFYYISTGAFIDGIEIDALDWIGAFNGDVVSCFF